ncbi:hypothetical protein Misp01_52490 [Microtetraspora sp. NBRC 13810]|uniref:hypothetical protein n=1 Tax=Microtetraspora sp. NBRC 13810 TaxID=3030990 RepID=UPI00255562AE|nr:hypothetical protein [Microtetraspora sp. NBRC 13810]GLW10120.1 hypothetical protein Misp01_52490 [Microtetraspora sp. NBRC 13810]
MQSKRLQVLGAVSLSTLALWPAGTSMATSAHGPAKAAASSQEDPGRPDQWDGDRWRGDRWNGDRWDGDRWDGDRWDGGRWDGDRWDGGR